MRRWMGPASCSWSITWVSRWATARRKFCSACRLAITSLAPQADEKENAQALLEIARGHWSIENSCHYVLDMTWDEDRCRIRTGHGPENTSRLRRFAISVLNLHAKPGESIASMTRRLAAKTRLVFDYLLMTKNSTGHAPAS